MKQDTTKPETNEENAEEMVLISVSVTRHQKIKLGRDRSFKVRQALVLAGYPEQPITDKI